MKTKGFTLVELITTFSLTAVIVVLLLNVIVVIKNIYSKYDIKTELIINQNDLSIALNSKFINNNLSSYNICDNSSDEFCYEFNFKDGTKSVLKVDDSTIKFDNYVYKKLSGSKIGQASITYETLFISEQSENNSFLIISVPITNKLYDSQDFGVKIIYQYNSNVTNL